MKSKLIESAGYISIALVLALTLVLSFSAIDFDSGITAQAAAPSENTLNNYPGSISILAPGWEYDSTELYYNDGANVDYYTVYPNTTVGLEYFENNPNSILQFIFYVDYSTEEDAYLYLDGISLPFAAFGVASDNGYGDLYFVYSYVINDDMGEGSPFFEVIFHQFLDDYSNDIEFIYLYDIRLITPSESNSTTDTFFSIIGDGISFGFESIAGGITYTVDSLFFEDGNLTDFSIIIFCMTGISLALAIIKYILRIIFSFGGIKL